LRVNALTHGVESINGFFASMRDHMTTSFSTLLRIPATKSAELWSHFQQSGLYKKVGLVIGVSKEAGTNLLNSLMNLKNFIMSYMPNTETFAAFGKRMKMSLSGVKNWIFGIPVSTAVAIPSGFTKATGFSSIHSGPPQLALGPATSLPPLSSAIPILHDPPTVNALINTSKNALAIITK